MAVVADLGEMFQCAALLAAFTVYWWYLIASTWQTLLLIRRIFTSGIYVDLYYFQYLLLSVQPTAVSVSTVDSIYIY